MPFCICSCNNLPENNPIAYTTDEELFGYLGAYGFSSLLVVLVILGVLNGITAPPSMAMVGDITGQEDSAMGMGFFNFMGNLGIAIGPLLFGYLILTTSFITAFLVVGLLELATLMIIAILIRYVFEDTAE